MWATHAICLVVCDGIMGNLLKVMILKGESDNQIDYANKPGNNPNTNPNRMVSIFCRLYL